MGSSHTNFNKIINDSIINIETTISSFQVEVEQQLKQKLTEGQKEFLEGHLQKATTLNGLDIPLLRSLLKVDKLLKSVCMLKIGEGEIGTAFLADIPGTGIAFFSAGHNFESILNHMAPKYERRNSLNDYIVHFGNVSGAVPPSNNIPLPRKGNPMNLTEFLRPFEVCGSISYDGKRVLYHKGELVNYTCQTDAIRKAEDYCVLLLNGNDVKEKLDALGLEYLVCGHDEYLKCTDGGLVAIFGHPVGIENEMQENHRYPFRMSFGTEKDPDKTKGFYSHSNEVIKILSMLDLNSSVKRQWGDDYPRKDVVRNYIFYDNDTFPGNSGSPVIGRGAKDMEQGYSVKGIHVRSFNREDTNGAQNIQNALEWINIGRNYNSHIINIPDNH